MSLRNNYCNKTRHNSAKFEIVNDFMNFPYFVPLENVCSTNKHQRENSLYFP